MIYVADVSFGPNTEHKVRFHFHRTAKGMRTALRRMDNDDYRTTVGCCLNPVEFDGSLVSDVHYALDELVLDTLAHECLHAAMRRGHFLGVKDQDKYEESLAEDVGYLTHQAWLVWKTIQRKSRKKN